MATDQHSTSRRAVIGALAAAPIIATASVVEAAAIGGVSAETSGATNTQADIFALSTAADGRTLWERRLAKYIRLNVARLAHPYGSTPVSDPDYKRLEREDEVLVYRACRAPEDLLRTPAPDFVAHVEKLELFAREYEDMSDGGLAHIIADARRFLSGEG